MGTTFTNLQVREHSIDEIEKVIPHCTARNLSNGWTTIVSERFQVGDISKVGRKLSTAINKSVLSIEYFDEDVLRMTIYRDGKAVTSHVNPNGYNVPPKMGSPKVFLEELGFDLNESKYFKEVLKCEDLGKKIELLQHFLGVALWIDDRMLIDGAESEFHYERNIDLVKEYISELRKKNDIKNQTKANIIMEFEGALITGLGNNKFLIGIPPYLNHSYEKELMYTFLPNGILDPIMDLTSFQYERGTNFLTATNEYITFYCPLRRKYYVFDYHGNMISETSMSTTVTNPIYTFNDGAFLTGNAEAKKIVWYGPELEMKREFPYYTYFFVFGQSIYLYRIDESKYIELKKLNFSGQIEAEINLEFDPTWYIGNFRCLIGSEGRIYFFCNLFAHGKSFTRIMCFTEKLEKIKEIDLDGDARPLIDNTNHKIFLHVFDKELIVIDALSLQIISRRDWDDYELDIMTVDSLGRLLVLVGNSRIYLLDTQLNMISHHRLKGGVRKYTFINESGNLCLITGSEEPNEMGWTSSNMKIRVYEIMES
ncbi:hypothetical protein [Paenibacillus sp. FSL K6-2524]|uniref:hypothetical protein n=1 Tax=Paenibacillus sp. FSL K6-2524 TaxID=2954516 RepID=UPI0030F8F7C9